MPWKIISSSEGVELFHKYDLPSFYDAGFSFASNGRGVVAYRPCELGGVEIHIAFKKGSRHKAREDMRVFIGYLKRPIWAFVIKDRVGTVNMAKKLGFKYFGLLDVVNGESVKQTHFLRID